MTEDNKNQSGRSRALVGTTWFKVAIVIGLVLGGYAIFGFFAAPRWLRVAATQETEKALGVPLGLGEIRINPFLLKLTVDDISLPDRAVDEPLIALDRLYVDFEAIASLFNRALAFKDIALTGPFARVIILPDKSLNLAALAPQTESAASEPDDDSGLPALWVQKFDVQAGRVNFADRSRRMAPEKTIAPIEFSLRDFRTNPEGGAATLDARSEDGEGFEWAGQIALAPVASQGRFSLTALKRAHGLGVSERGIAARARLRLDRPRGELRIRTRSTGPPRAQCAVIARERTRAQGARRRRPVGAVRIDRRDRCSNQDDRPDPGGRTSRRAGPGRDGLAGTRRIAESDAVVRAGEYRCPCSELGLGPDYRRRAAADP
jgi:hypothetical protein